MFHCFLIGEPLIYFFLVLKFWHEKLPDQAHANLLWNISVEFHRMSKNLLSCSAWHYNAFDVTTYLLEKMSVPMKHHLFFVMGFRPKWKIWSFDWEDWFSLHQTHQFGSRLMECMIGVLLLLGAFLIIHRGY